MTNHFQFKQFRIDQNNAAMKVGTDGVLLGAWADVNHAKTILDIGTGTGLIALMMAQRSHAIIDAIDIESNAIMDAEYNFKNSSWSNRLTASCISLQDFTKNNKKKYDCIVSNPPFFNNSCQSDKREKMTARHTDSMSYEVLIKSVAESLSKSGTFSVILPSESEPAFIQIASTFLMHPSRITRVLPKPSKPIKRVMMEFGFQLQPLIENKLIYETEIRHTYTKEASMLLSDFYLKL